MQQTLQWLYFSDSIFLKATQWTAGREGTAPGQRGGCFK